MPSASVNQAAAEAAEIFRTVRARGQEEYYRMKSEDGIASSTPICGAHQVYRGKPLAPVHYWG